MADNGSTLHAPGGSRGSSPSLRPGRLLPIRTVLVTTAVGCLVLLYIVWWTTYAGIHFDQRFTQPPAGQSTTVRGTTVTLASLTRSPLLADQQYGGPPDPAEPGAVWVIAELEAVRAADAPEFVCTLELLGPEARRWSMAYQSKRSTPWCGEEDLLPGGHQRFEMVFAVPERFATQLFGVAVLDSSSADRAAVLTPPG